MELGSGVLDNCASICHGRPHGIFDNGHPTSLRRSEKPCRCHPVGQISSRSFVICHDTLSIRLPFTGNGHSGERLLLLIRENAPQAR